MSDCKQSSQETLTRTTTTVTTVDDGGYGKAGWCTRIVLVPNSSRTFPLHMYLRGVPRPGRNGFLPSVKTSSKQNVLVEDEEDVDSDKRKAKSDIDAAQIVRFSPHHILSSGAKEANLPALAEKMPFASGFNHIVCHPFG